MISTTAWEQRIRRRAANTARVVKGGESWGRGSVGKDLRKGSNEPQVFISRALQAEGTAMPKSPERSVKEH